MAIDSGPLGAGAVGADLDFVVGVATVAVVVVVAVGAAIEHDKCVAAVAGVVVVAGHLIVSY